MWSAASGSIYTVLEGSSTATCCSFDLVGKLLAVGTVLGTTVLYNLETVEMLTELKVGVGAGGLMELTVGGGGERATPGTRAQG